MTDHSCCDCKGVQQSVIQTLDEMAFERGIWPAAMNGELDRVQELISKGTDVNARDNSCFTALHYASRSGHHSICTLLLKNGANPNAQTSGGATPLHRAAYTNRIQVVNLLIRNGANPLLIDSDGKTSLHKAAEQGHAEVAKILIESNRNILLVIDIRDRTAYDIAKDNQSKTLQDPSIYSPGLY